MSTTKKPLKLYLSQESLERLEKLHPGYGERSRVVQELINQYLEKHQRETKNV